MFEILFFIFSLRIAFSEGARDPSAEQLTEYKNSVVDQSTLLTSFGTPVDNLRCVLTAGPRGPVLLQDTNFIENVAHFDHEVTLERVVHGKGNGAFGTFKVTNDITQYTKASVFSKIGKETKVAVRFSIPNSSRGSPQTVRGGRGFACKFYTDEGIWDLVTNNAPVFIINDPMLFPSFVHLKRNPVTNLPDADATWDFFTWRTETIHQVLILFSDAGIPDGNRHINGFGINAFKLVNKDGKAVYCKFHLLTQQGIKNLTPEEAAKWAALDPDYETRDLYNAIKTGNFPKWKLYIQVMTFEQAEKLPWNPFDATKLWPESDYPLILVGELELNENPSNYFTDVEQIAFSPSNMPPGIEASPDKLLQGRMFSYPDSQRYRLGPNFMQLPINMPRGINVTNYQRDGPATINNQGGAPNYLPDSFLGPAESPAGKIQSYSVCGDVDRYESDGDHFSQPAVYWNGLSAEEQTRLVTNMAGSLGRAAVFLQERAVKNFCKVDKRLGEMLSSVLKINVAC